MNISSRLKLLPEDVHVVRVRLDVVPSRAMEVLDDRERQRAARFMFDRDRQRFVAVHAWVRILIGRCVGHRPESLRFSYGPHGKPALAEPQTDLRFNVSHGGERALLALTLGRDVGIDIEQERPIDVLDLARRFFSRSEWEALQAVDASERIPAFFRGWTRKEAFLKALGVGLGGFPLSGFAVSLADDASQPLLRSCSASPDALRKWRIVPLLTDEGYAAALAAQAGDWRVVRCDAMADDS